jgi:hypothetical protein
MSMDSAISFESTDYGNGERYFSAKQDQNNVSIYYLKGALLVKGYSEAQMKQLAPNTIFMMPMAFAVPLSILAEALPAGPCTLAPKTSVSKQLSGAMRIQDRKLSNAVGQVSSGASGEISYQIDVSIEPPAPGKTSVRYSGEMTFAPLKEAPPEDVDLTGYLLVTSSSPFSVVGSADIPLSKLGELRQLLRSRQKAPNPAPQPTR